MAFLSGLSTLLLLLFSLCVSANVVPRYPVTTSSSPPTTIYTGAVVLPTAFSGSCPAIDQQRYASPYGVYLIECYVDHSGSDLSGDGQVTASFQICLDQCASTSSCSAVTWEFKSGKCYKHKQAGTPKANIAAWGAKWISGPVPSAPVSSSAASTSTTSSTVAPTTTSLPVLGASSSSTISSGPSSVSGGLESTFVGPTSIPGPAPVILGPVIPPGFDKTNLALLTPQKVSGLYYSGGTNSSDPTATTGTVAKLSLTLQYPSIPLDQSIYITTTCSNAGLTATFSNAASYAQAQSTWPTTGTIILITAASGCSSDGQNVYFQTSSIVFHPGSLTATATGTMVDLAAIFSDLGLDFGNILATSNSSAGGSSSTPVVDNCGTPSNATIDGLPAVACGSNFDQTLDNLLGFYPGDDADIATVVAEIAPGTSSSLRKRSFLSKIIKVVAPVVKAVVQQAVTVVAPVIKAVVPQVVQQAVAKVATVVSNVVTTVVTAAASFLTGTFSQSLNIPISIVVPSAMLSSSPWGNQFKFYSYELGSSDPSYTAKDAALELIQGDLFGDPNPVPGIELFCVNCGVTGNIQLIGSVSISALEGFYAGSIGMQGSLEAGLFVGVNGFYEWQKEIDATILSAGLPGFSIPEVVTLGPELELGISASLTVDAVGQILVGTSYSWPAISATLDVMNSANSQRSGFSPTVNRQFDAYGDITATASLGLPVTLSFGLTFFSGKWSKTVDIKDVPSLNAVAEFSLNAGASSSGSQVNTTFSIDTNGCNGISWNVDLANEVDLDIGSSTTYTLWQWAGPVLAQGCIGRSVTSSSSSSSSKTTASSTFVTSSKQTLTSLSTASSSVSPSSSQVLSTIVFYVNPLATSTSTLTSTTLSSKYSTQTSQAAWSTVLYISPLSSSTTLPFTPISSGLSSSPPVSGPSSTQQSQSTSTTVSTGGWSSSSSPAPTLSGSSSLSSSSTKTSSAAVAIITNSLGVNDTIDCSVDNGRIFTDAQGYVYQIQCHVDLPNDSMGSEDASSFEQCIADCFNQQDHDCIAVVWIPSQTTGNCNFKQDRNTLPANVSDSTYGYEVDSAVLISAPSCDSLTCPSNDAQYCMSNGEMFKMSCEIAYMANQLGNFNLETLGECIDACSSGWPGVCNGVTFFPAQWKAPTTIAFPSANCFPFAEGDNPVSYAAAEGGISALSRSARNQGYGLWKRGIESAPPSLKTRQTTTQSVTYTTVSDTTNTLALLTADDGNLFVDLSNNTAVSNTTESTFAFYGDALFGDAQDRYLHYYPSNIAAVGASRLRLAPWGSIPTTAALISLAPISDGTETVLVAVDTLGNYYWLYVCAIANQQNKVFLVDDPTNGAGILQDPSLMFTVTGGVVNDCAILALAAHDVSSLN